MALKKLKCTDFCAEGMPFGLLREVTVLSMLKGHPNVVELLDFYLNPKPEQNCFILCFEFAEQGDLSKHITNLRQSIMKQGLSHPGVDFTFVRRVLKQLFQGVEFMHSKGIIHRDLKTANILLYKDGRIKIADFGLSRLVRHPLKPLTKEVQSMWYRPPEILLGNHNYTFAVDYWSLGIIAYELVYLTHRFQGTSEIDMLFKIFQQKGTPDLLTQS